MKNKLSLFARVLLGLEFTIFGLNGFFDFIPMPETMPAQVVEFMTALMNTGYFFPFVKAVEVICGIALLANVFVPLALVILAPIVVNIVLIHAFLDPSGLPMAVTTAILLVYLGFGPYQRHFDGVLQVKADPQ